MRDFVIRPAPLLTPVQIAERTLVDVLGQTMPEQGTLITFRGMPGSGVDRVLQKALEYAREHEWLEYFVGLVPWEREVPYSALERVCLKMEGLRHLLPDLTPDHDPIDLGQRVLQALDAHFEADDRVLLMVFDHLEHCDSLSSIVFRYIVMRATARGANFVLGDSLAQPVDLGDELRQVVYTEPHAHLVVLPEFSAAEIMTYVSQRAGSGVALREGERVRRLTGGRYDAIVAYLDSISDEYLADLADIRALPSVTSARMPGTPELHLDELSEMTRLAAEVCALQPDGVSLQTLKLVANRAGTAFSMESAVDGVTVVTNSLTGMLHLYDPLSAPDILQRTGCDRLRVIHAALSDLTYGNESRIHSVLAAQEIDEHTASRIIETATELEAAGDAVEALELLDVAVDRASENASSQVGYRQLLLKFGHVFLRQASPLQFQERISDFAKFAASDLEFGFIYTWLRTVKAHGRTDGRDVRLEYLAVPPQDIDHEFMQAEIARLDLVAALQTGSPGIPDALAAVRARYGELSGKRPENPELQWMHAEQRLLFTESLAFAIGASAGQITDAVPKARGLAERAAQLPDESPDAVDAMTSASLVLAGLGRCEDTAAFVQEARRREPYLAHSTNMGGQLDALDLHVRYVRGDFGGMRDFLDSAFYRAFEGFDMPTRITVPAFYAWILAVSGRLEEAERYLTVAKQSDQYHYPGFAVDMMPVAEALITRLRQGVPEALQVLDAAAAEPRFARSLRLRVARIELLALLGRVEEATQIWAEVESIQDRVNGGQILELEWLRGVFQVAGGDIEVGIETLEHSAAEAESPFTIGRCHLALGNAYAQVRGPREVVQEHFELARRAFTKIGAKSFADLAVARLQETTSESQELVAALTPRERQVATLAARGWRNKEIARELNIGVATVAFHMSNALEKLRISKRSELSAVIGNGL
ncbi:helix-turn-helix transcriptional regulator [Gulosibacter chungangensis]|uniref:Response regulator transcription factor n=1 Tax=Gulosibacter chungangensis TaxID=979746 RepID=A0A7J5B9F7_9MICO|nr:LuxR C-terminal-related transcriptional regulator [Gulosibacter chungangensis]KAB1641196.1 response regulator transcription factor [Gulosibacter chungangensis]